MGLKVLTAALLLFQVHALGATSLQRQWSHEFDDLPDPTLPAYPTPPEFLHENSWNNFFASLENASRVTFGLAWNGATPYRANPEQGFSPASTLKMVTASAALEALGVNFKFTNSFQGFVDTQTGTLVNAEFNLSGDPTWGHAAFGETLTGRLETLAAALKGAKVKTIRGAISFLTTNHRVKNFVRPQRWKESWLDQCYAGMVTPAILNGNCADLRITSKVSAQWVTPGVSIPVTISMSKALNTQKLVVPKVSAETDPLTGRVVRYNISGSYALNQNIISLPAHQSEKWLKTLFLAELKKVGISYSAVKAPTAVRNSLKKVAFFQDLSSKPLHEMIVPFLQDSINIFGERIYLETAERLGAVNDADPERMFLERITSGHALNAVTEIYDGSGLIAASRLAPELMLLFLERVQFEPYFNLFFNALPVAGISGTIQSRMDGPLTRGRVHAKSGTLDGVSCLSGYYQKNEAELKPFVIITLSDLSASSVLRPMQDKIVTQFVDYNR